MTYIPPTLEASGSVGIDVLRGRHPGSLAYIVGKGPSLANVLAADFAPGAPVIVLNEAIAAIQVLGLPNQIYSMQRDGCVTEDQEHIARPCGSCEALGWIRPPLIDPYPGIAVVFSQYLSSWCMHGRANRFVMTDDEMGYPGGTHTMSVLTAIPFAKHLGATSIVMISFDSLTSGDLGYAFEYGDAEMEVLRSNLEWVRPRVLAALEAVGPHSFFTPPQSRRQAA